LVRLLSLATVPSDMMIAPDKICVCLQVPRL
jgi:hypothetical protein